MHFYKATVKLRKPGDTSYTHELPIGGLSAPEVIILRHIHGEDSLTNLRPDGERNVRQHEELDRLRSIYNVAVGNGAVRDVVRYVFGPVPQLPLEVDLPAEEDEPAAPTSSTLSLPKKAAA